MKFGVSGYPPACGHKPLAMAPANPPPRQLLQPAPPQNRQPEPCPPAPMPPRSIRQVPSLHPSAPKQPLAQSPMSEQQPSQQLALQQGSAQVSQPQAGSQPQEASQPQAGSQPQEASQPQAGSQPQDASQSCEHCFVKQLKGRIIAGRGARCEVVTPHACPPQPRPIIRPLVQPVVTMETTATRSKICLIRFPPESRCEVARNL